MNGATATELNERAAEAANPTLDAPTDTTAAASNGKALRIKPNLDFKRDLVEFGGANFNQCCQCAVCSVACDLSGGQDPYPRKEMIWAQWGLDDRIVRDADIWACHYCGHCSTKCTRGANPGELLMALRRYAISRYDWTGLSRRLYTSRAWEIGAILFVAAIVVGLFALSGAFTPERMGGEHVSVNTFIPVDWVHYGDWTMAAVLTFFLLTNAYRMSRFVLDGQKIPMSVFVAEAKTFFVQMAFQKNWRDCAGGPSRWIKHFILVTGYATIFLLVMFFLHAFQVDSAQFTWVSLLGYYGTFAILYFSTDSMLARLRKTDEAHKFSHDSDWMFLIMLFLTGLTGIFMHLLRLMDQPQPTYIMYVIHLCVAVPMLVVEVPFGKWSHLLYRPLALYLKAVKERARVPQTA